MLGLANGIRTTGGFAILALAHRADGEPLVRSAGLRRTILAAFAGEAVADKVAELPARTDPLPLAGRLLLGGAAAALAVSRPGVSRLAAGLVGAFGALCAAHAATSVRAAAESRGTSDLLPALAEDAVVGALAVAVRDGVARDPSAGV